VVVYGEELQLEGSRLTGSLDDSSPLDVTVSGSLENLVLIPEPAGWALQAQRPRGHSPWPRSRGAASRRAAAQLTRLLHRLLRTAKDLPLKSSPL
jgi:hypothetical protein